MHGQTLGQHDVLNNLHLSQVYTQNMSFARVVEKNKFYVFTTELGFLQWSQSMVYILENIWSMHGRLTRDEFTFLTSL